MIAVNKFKTSYRNIPIELYIMRRVIGTIDPTVFRSKIGHGKLKDIITNPISITLPFSSWTKDNIKTVCLLFHVINIGNLEKATIPLLHGNLQGRAVIKSIWIGRKGTFYRILWSWPATWIMRCAYIRIEYIFMAVNTFRWSYISNTSCIIAACFFIDAGGKY